MKILKNNSKSLFYDCYIFLVVCNNAPYIFKYLKIYHNEALVVIYKATWCTFHPYPEKLKKIKKIGFFYISRNRTFFKNLYFKRYFVQAQKIKKTDKKTHPEFFFLHFRKQKFLAPGLTNSYIFSKRKILTFQEKDLSSPQD